MSGFYVANKRPSTIQDISKESSAYLSSHCLGLFLIYDNMNGSSLDFGGMGQRVENFEKGREGRNSHRRDVIKI